MMSHELAKLLLEQPNLPVATHANNHTYMSKHDKGTHGSLKVGILFTHSGEHIIIGNIFYMDLNKPNWFITKMIHGTAK